MSQLPSRIALTFAALSCLTVSCAGDQKSPDTASGAAEEQAPVMKTTPAPAQEGATPPNGQPPGMPPSDPPPQGLNSTSPSNALASPTVGQQPAKPTLTEAQIARIAELVNSAEIEQAKVAQNKAKSPRVKSFAAKMIKHHGQAKAEQAKLTQKLGVGSADSADATALRNDGEQTLATLKSTSAATFDMAYIDSQVTGHEKVLATIDEQLLPSAKTESVMSALRTAREAVAAHLAEAKEIQAELATTTRK